MRKLISTAALGALSLLLLSGCASGPQTLADACETAMSGVTSVTSDIAESRVAIDDGDAKGAAVLLEDVTAQLESTAGKVTNDKVTPGLVDFTKQVSAYVDLVNVEAAKESTTAATFVDVSTGIYTAYTALIETCA